LAFRENSNEESIAGTSEASQASEIEVLRDQHEAGRHFEFGTMPNSVLKRIGRPDHE